MQGAVVLLRDPCCLKDIMIHVSVACWNCSLSRLPLADNVAVVNIGTDCPCGGWLWLTESAGGRFAY
jgi:hypothetical protein